MEKIQLSGEEINELFSYLNARIKAITPDDENDVLKALSRKLSHISKNKKMPGFARRMVVQARNLRDLLEMDNINKDEKKLVFAGLEYLVNTQDKIPDHIPMIGYLDDAHVINSIHSKLISKINKMNGSV